MGTKEVTGRSGVAIEEPLGITNSIYYMEARLGQLRAYTHERDLSTSSINQDTNGWKDGDKIFEMKTPIPDI